MKKLSSLLILLLVAQLAFAQGKFTKKLTSSDEDIANDKKKTQPKTWVKRGDLFIEIAEEPVKDMIIGMDRTTFNLQVKGKPEVKQWIGPASDLYPEGEPFEVLAFPDKDVYFTTDGILAFWTITSTEVENPVSKALEAYQKAEELEAQPRNNKDLKSGFANVARIFNLEANAAYSLGKDAEALNDFQKVYEANSSKTLGLVDTLTMYNVGFLASETGDYNLAEEFYKKAIDNGYDREGSLYANLADVMSKNGKRAQAEELLANAFTQYPNNQGILVGLINFYLQDGDDPLKVLPYIKKAQENEPANGSLDYAEGMLYDKLGDVDKAAAAYKSAIGKNANDFYSLYSLGALYYNEAIEIGKKADALPFNAQAEYDAYIVEINKLLRMTIEPFEAAYRLEPNAAIIESLKNVYYRFVDESPEMKANYEKYDALLKEATK